MRIDIELMTDGVLNTYISGTDSPLELYFDGILRYRADVNEDGSQVVHSLFQDYQHEVERITEYNDPDIYV